MPDTLAFVTPELIEWARRRLNLSPDAVAAKVRTVSAAQITAWEARQGHPTFRQAITLAARLNVPFGFLFLSEPPALDIPLPDLRTVTGEPLGEPSPEFIDLIYDVLRKQQWFRDYQESTKADSLPSIGRPAGRHTAITATAIITTPAAASRTGIGSGNSLATPYASPSPTAAVISCRIVSPAKALSSTLRWVGISCRFMAS